MKPEILNRKTVHKGYLHVERLTVRLPAGPTALFEIASHGDSVGVLPFDEKRRCALVVRQFRVAVFAVCGEEFVIEACAGMIEGADTEASVRREAGEELGVQLDTLEFVAQVWPSSGVSTECTALFLAPYSQNDRIGPGGGLAAEHEDITVLEIRLSDLANDVDAGRIVDAKLLTLAMSLRLKRPDLFAKAGADDLPPH